MMPLRLPSSGTLYYREKQLLMKPSLIWFLEKRGLKQTKEKLAQ